VIVECQECYNQKVVEWNRFKNTKGACRACGAGFYKGSDRKRHAEDREYASKYGSQNRFRQDNPYEVCAVCGISEWNGTPLKMDVDHIVPRAFGGKNSLDNLQYLCPNCHRQKTQEEMY
jgi:5-methylcytosine-specific restriction endonuclease McrA